jgi:hypothetical protein
MDAELVRLAGDIVEFQKPDSGTRRLEREFRHRRAVRSNHHNLAQQGDLA